MTCDLVHASEARGGTAIALHEKSLIQRSIWVAGPSLRCWVLHPRRPNAVRDAFACALRDWCKAEQTSSRAGADQLQRELSGLRQQQDRLLNLRLLDEIDADTFAQKQTELRDRIAAATLSVEAADRSRAEHAELAIKVFELSQSLTTRWLAAEVPEKRQMLELICSNFTLDGATLVPTMRKPFDVLAEGLLVSSSRGERI